MTCVIEDGTDVHRMSLICGQIWSAFWEAPFPAVTAQRQHLCTFTRLLLNQKLLALLPNNLQRRNDRNPTKQLTSKGNLIFKWRHMENQHLLLIHFCTRDFFLMKGFEKKKALRISSNEFKCQGDASESPECSQSCRTAWKAEWKACTSCSLFSGSERKGDEVKRQANKLQWAPLEFSAVNERFEPDLGSSGARAPKSHSDLQLLSNSSMSKWCFK